MNRVLLLSYYFPPLAGIASERAAAFARHLPGNGWEPVVVAPRRGHFHVVESQPPQGCRVVRTANPEPSRVLRRAWGAGAEGTAVSDHEVTPVSTGSFGGLLRVLARELLYVPDAQLAWIPFARRATLRLIEEERARPTVVYSSSVPYSAHLAAGMAARRAGVPWVAEFRDPWTVHDEAFLPRTALRRGVDRRLEDWILRTAHHLVVTSDGTRELFLQRFRFLDPRRVSVVRNGFEPMEPGTPPGPDEPMRLVHAGTLHEAEFARPLVEALARIEARTPGSVRLEVWGDPAPWRELLGTGRGGTERWLEIGGVLDPSEARERIRHASVLLLPAADERFRRILLGKLLTYLGSRRPILGVVPAGSDMDRLIASAADGWMIRPWDARGVEAALDRLLSAHREGSLQAPRVAVEAVEPYGREAQAAELARVFEAAWSRGTTP